ncbi:HERV-H LTR-associating protein 1 [Morphnus guianensis]
MATLMPALNSCCKSASYVEKIVCVSAEEQLSKEDRRELLIQKIFALYKQGVNGHFLAPHAVSCSETPSFSELPAKSVDLAAINLTELVNGMLNTALRGTKKLFSLLSVTSYSSFAFHKVSVTIYNSECLSAFLHAGAFCLTQPVHQDTDFSLSLPTVSNVKNVDPGKFPMHYCYCLNNVTNDLTDFTALLVDIIGNSTSYLTEIFKSTSILSVRQSNDSDCIYICVMTGQTGRNLSSFGEMLEKSPVINYTFSSNKSSDLDLDLMFSSFMKLQEDPNKTVDPSAEHVWTFKTDMYAFWMQTVSPQETSRLMQTEPDLPSSVLPMPPYRPAVTLKLYSATRCPQAILKESRVTSPPVTLIVQKINPCVMELCRFFQLCLCVGQRRYSRKEAMRYCVEYYSWFLKNASYVCERVKRIAYSHTLKQKCLKNICTSV